MITLLDTGPLVAMLDRDESCHEQCRDAMHAAGDSLVTCEAVIVEACYLLRHLPGAAHDLLLNVDAGRFRLEYSMSARAQPLAKLMAKYSDIPMDLADACLVDMATAFKTGRILTLDADFSIYRWGKNRPFELLLEL